MAEAKVAPWQLVLPLGNVITLLASSQLVTAEALALLGIQAAWVDLISTTHDLIEIALAVATCRPVSQVSGLLMFWLLLVGAPSSGKAEDASPMKNKPDVYHLDAGLRYYSNG